MCIEIEAKVKVADHAPIRQRLREQGGMFLCNVLETNTFFDRPDHGLQSGDRGLRIRRIVEAETGLETATMTMKGPRQPGLLKRREELEIDIDDPETAMLILDRLGLERTLSFEKRRESWHLENCLVELDELPYLGCFVEIEGSDEQSIEAARKLLNLSGHPLIRAGYISLLVAHMKGMGMSSGIIRFHGSAEKLKGEQ